MHTSHIPGQPFGKERPRAAKRGGFVSIYTPPKTKKWELEAGKIMLENWDGYVFDTTIELEVLALFPRIKDLRCTHKRKPCSCAPEILEDRRLPCEKKPDWDNIGKIASDALQSVGILDDDCKIIVGRVMKFWAGHSEEPGTYIRVSHTDTLGYDVWPLSATKTKRVTDT